MRLGLPPPVWISCEKSGFAGSAGLIGQILRAGENRLIFQALAQQHRMGSPGSLLMDMPHYSSLDELADLAADPLEWSKLEKLIF